MSEQAIRRTSPDSVRKALTFFRVMAVASGLALFVLVVIIVMNGGFGRGGASQTWSPIHGAIYFVYVVSITNLGFKIGWSLPKMLLTMLSGFVPVLPFVIERRVTREVTEQLGTIERR